MAAEAAEGPSLPPPRAGEAEPPVAPAPEKRAPAERDEKEQGGEERPEPKRRRARARISALESVPRAAEVAAAAAAAVAGREAETASCCDGEEASSFSFHARSVSSAQTTPKFGSFDPGATAELVAFHLMKASRRLVSSSRAEELGDHRTAAGGGENAEKAAAEGRDGNSR